MTGLLFSDLKVKAAGVDDNLPEGSFTAYASVFNNVDSYRDVVRPGAFTKTLAEWTVSGDSLPILWGHDMADPFSNIGHVSKATEDDRGLLVEGQLDLENPKAQQVYRLIKGRRINQMSFAYDVIDSTPETVDGIPCQLLNELKIYEVSIVPIGANRETEILAVKATAEALLKEGKKLSAKTVTSLRAAYEAIGDVLADAEPVKDAKTVDETGQVAKAAPPVSQFGLAEYENVISIFRKRHNV